MKTCLNLFLASFVLAGCANLQQQAGIVPTQTNITPQLGPIWNGRDWAVERYNVTGSNPPNYYCAATHRTGAQLFGIMLLGPNFVWSASAPSANPGSIYQAILSFSPSGASIPYEVKAGVIPGQVMAINRGPDPAAANLPQQISEGSSVTVTVLGLGEIAHYSLAGSREALQQLTECRSGIAGGGIVS